MEAISLIFDYVSENRLSAILILLLIIVIIFWLISKLYQKKNSFNDNSLSSLNKKSYQSPQPDNHIAPTGAEPVEKSITRQPAAISSPPIFKNSWETFIYLTKKNLIWLAVIILVLESATTFYLISQESIYEATTRIMVHQKPGEKYVSNVYQSEQVSLSISTALVQIILTQDFENKVLDLMIEKDTQNYPAKLLERLKNNFALATILNKNGVIDGVYIRRLPVISIYTIGSNPEEARVLGKYASAEIIKEAQDIYGGDKSIDMRVIEPPIIARDPIFPRIKITILFVLVASIVIELFILYVVAESRFFHQHDNK